MKYPMQETEGAQEAPEPSGEMDPGRIAQIGQDLARIAKSVRDPAIRSQLETYSDELSGLAGEEGSEGDEEAPAADMNSTGDKMAVAQLRKSVKF